MGGPARCPYHLSRLLTGGIAILRTATQQSLEVRRGVSLGRLSEEVVVHRTIEISKSNRHPLERRAMRTLAVLLLLNQVNRSLCELVLPPISLQAVLTRVRLHLLR